jgi:hypothetical protein
VNWRGAFPATFPTKGSSLRTAGGCGSWSLNPKRRFTVESPPQAWRRTCDRACSAISLLPVYGAEGRQQFWLNQITDVDLKILGSPEVPSDNPDLYELGLGIKLADDRNYDTRMPDICVLNGFLSVFAHFRQWRWPKKAKEGQRRPKKAKEGLIAG